MRFTISWSVQNEINVVRWRSITMHVVSTGNVAVCICTLTKNEQIIMMNVHRREIWADRLTRRHTMTPKLYGTNERDTTIDWIEWNRNRNRFKVIHFSQHASNGNDGGGGGASASAGADCILACVCVCNVLISDFCASAAHRRLRLHQPFSFSFLLCCVCGCLPACPLFHYIFHSN